MNNEIGGCVAIPSKTKKKTFHIQKSEMAGLPFQSKGWGKYLTEMFADPILRSQLLLLKF